MLVLTRKVGQDIIIGDNIRITITQIKGDKVRIGIDAPPQVTVDRQEVHHSPARFHGPDRHSDTATSGPSPAGRVLSPLIGREDGHGPCGPTGFWEQSHLTLAAVLPAPVLPVNIVSGFYMAVESISPSFLDFESLLANRLQYLWIPTTALVVAQTRGRTNATPFMIRTTRARMPYRISAAPKAMKVAFPAASRSVRQSTVQASRP